MTFRDVIFRLTVENHPDLSGKLSSFGDQVGKAYETVMKEADAAGRKMSSTVPGMDESTVRETTQARVRAERESSQAVMRERTTISQLEDQVAEDRRQNDIAKLKAFSDEKLRTEEALVKAELEIRKKVQQNFPGDQEALDAALVAAREKAAARIRRIDERLQKERVRQAQTATKERLSLLKREQRALESAEAIYESMQGQIRSARQETLTAIGEIGSSLMTTARGFVALGLAGEEDLEKVVQGLLKVQGAFDIVSGSIQTWIKLNQAIEGVRKTILATALAEEALGKASVARAAIQTAGGSVAGAAGRGAAAGAAGGLAGGALTNARLAGRLAGQVGRGVSGAASRTGPLAAAGILGMSVLDLIRGGGQFNQGSFSQRFFTMGSGISGRVDQMLGFDTAAASAASSRDALGRQEALNASSQAVRDRQRELVGQELGGIRRGFGVRAQASASQLQFDLSQLSGSGSFRQREARLAEELWATERKIAEVREAASSTIGHQEELIAEFNAEQVRLEQRKKDLPVERASVARDAAQAELDASERALQTVQQRINRQQQGLQSLQDSMRSSRERFGLLDAGQQNSILDIFRRGQSGANLNPEELRLLKQVGSKAADAIVSGQASRRADMAGADALFGGEAAEIERLEREISRNVDVQAEIRWNLEFDQAALNEQSKVLADAVRSGLREQVDRIRDDVVSALSGEVAGVNVRVDALEQRVVDGAGGRL